MDIKSKNAMARLVAEWEASGACGARETADGETVYKVALAMARGGYRHSRQTVEAVSKYLSGAGLWMQGGCGTGKTYFFDRIEAARESLNIQGRKLYMLPMSQLVTWGKGELWAWLDRVRLHDVLLDDVGVEVVENDYGRKFEVLPTILDRRLSAYGRTHFTTNLDTAAIRKRYGAGAFDRMRSLACRITLVSESLRRDGVRVRYTLPTWPPLPGEEMYRVPVIGEAAEA